MADFSCAATDMIFEAQDFGERWTRAASLAPWKTGGGRHAKQYD
jgi:hypothetical protein